MVDVLLSNSQTSMDVLRWLAVVATSMLVGLRFLLADVLLLDWEMRYGLHSFKGYEPVFHWPCVSDRSFQFVGDVGVAQGVFLAVVFLALSEPRKPSAPDGSVDHSLLQGAGQTETSDV